METVKNELEQKKVMGVESNIFFAGLTSLLTDITVGLTTSIMPLFLMSIGSTKAQISLIEGIAESTASVLKAVSGWWSDKIGKNKPFMFIGYLMTAVITPIFAVTVTPLQVLFFRFLERTGKGIRTAPRDSLIAGSTTGKRTGKSFGIHKTMDNIGQMSGPLLAFLGLTLVTKNYKKIFLLAGIPALIGAIIIVFFIKEKKKKKEDLPGKIVLKDFSKNYYLFLLITFIFTLGNSTDALLLVKASNVGIPTNYVPLMYLVFYAVAVLLSIPIGVLSDKVGKEKLIITGYLIYAVVYFGFGMATTKLTIVLLFALYGLYSAATDGVQKALVTDFIDKDKRGTGLGLYNAILGITLLPASLIAGILYDKVDNSTPFYFGAVMALIATVMMFIFYFRRILPARKMQNKVS